MTFGCRNLNSRNNQEIIYRKPIVAHEFLCLQIINRVAGVVIGNGDTVQSFSLCARDQIFGAGNTVTGEKGMSMQVDIERHRTTTLICSKRNEKRRF
jgi:hypothetical protein